MSLQPFNVPQLQDSGLGASANLLGSLVNSQTNLINAKKERRKDILATLIGGGANIGNQLLENKQRDQTNDVNLEIAKQKQPSRFLQQANSYATLAKAAGDAGNFAQQEEFNKLAITFGQAASGGGGSLIGGSSANLNLPAASGGGFNMPSSDTDATAQPMQPAQSTEKPSDTYSISPKPASNFPTGVNFSTQQAAGKATQAQKDAQAATAKFNLGEGLGNVLNAPDKSKVLGIGGMEFQGVKLNPEIKSMMKNRAEELKIATDGSDYTKRVQNLEQGYKDTVTLLSAANTMNRIISSSPKAGLGAGVASLGRLIAGSAGKATPIRAMYDEQGKKALVAEDTLQGFVSGIKDLVGESGVLSQQDTTRLQGLLPKFSEDPYTANLKTKQLIHASLIPLMQTALSLGNDSMFNKLQKQFIEQTKQAYDGYSSAEDYDAKLSQSGFNKSTESKTGKATMGQPATTKQSSVDTSKGYKTYNVKPSSLKDELIYFNSL
jgi:hypothetical protein